MYWVSTVNAGGPVLQHWGISSSTTNLQITHALEYNDHWNKLLWSSFFLYVINAHSIFWKWENICMQDH